MLSSVVLSLLIFSLFVRCAPTLERNSFDASQATGFARDKFLFHTIPTDTSQAPSSIRASALYSRPNASATSDSPYPPVSMTTVAPSHNGPSSCQAMGDSTNFLVMAYYPDWAGPGFPPENINFVHFDWIDFAFAVPTENFDLKWDSEGAPVLLDRLVRAAHAGKAKVKLSIGGWTGSTFFSPAVATKASREMLSKNILKIYRQYNLDGIEIDWEYPGHEGASGNKIDPSDTRNFLLFLCCLRATLPSTARITAAVQTVPFTDSDGEIILEFADYLDWILIMNYDVWPSSPNPGPNAPMHDACKNSTQPEGNMVAAYNAWINAGFSPSQLVIGVPSYGYVSQSRVTNLRTRANSSTVAVTPNSGQIPFRDLVSQGALICTTPANPTSPRSCFASGGYERCWDGCSSTPFMRSSSAGQVITYDDPESLEMKAQLAKNLKILGINMFDVHGDTDQWDLTSSLRKGLGCS